tara:strand:- start:164 stop:541 length:378 start_codon:yes stop_codon:yes gene_type:complete
MAFVEAVKLVVKSVLQEPKQVAKYLALHVLDMDNEVTALVDSIRYFEVTHLPAVRNIEIQKAFVHHVSQGSFILVHNVGILGLWAIRHAWESKAFKRRVEEDTDWVRKNVESSWDGPGDWGIEND